MKMNHFNFIICQTRFLSGFHGPTSRTVLSCRVLVVLRTLIKASHVDIITGDFADTYDNLPLKTFAAYQYFLDFCPQATNLIMHDDDMIPSPGLHRPLHRVRLGPSVYWS